MQRGSPAVLFNVLVVWCGIWLVTTLIGIWAGNAYGKSAR